MTGKLGFLTVAVLLTAGCSRDFSLPAKESGPLAIEQDGKTFAPNETLTLTPVGGLAPYQYELLLPGTGEHPQEGNRDPNSPGAARNPSLGAEDGVYQLGSRGESRDLIQVKDARGVSALATIYSGPSLHIVGLEGALTPGQSPELIIAGGLAPYRVTLHPDPKVENTTGCACLYDVGLSTGATVDCVGDSGQGKRDCLADQVIEKVSGAFGYKAPEPGPVPSKLAGGGTSPEDPIGYHLKGVDTRRCELSAPWPKLKDRLVVRDSTGFEIDQVADVAVAPLEARLDSWDVHPGEERSLQIWGGHGPYQGYLSYNRSGGIFDSDRRSYVPGYGDLASDGIYVQDANRVGCYFTVQVGARRFETGPVTSLLATDLDANGLADLVSSTDEGGRPTLHINYSQGYAASETHRVRLDAPYRLLISADLNADGWQDLLLERSDGLTYWIEQGFGGILQAPLRATALVIPAPRLYGGRLAARSADLVAVSMQQRDKAFIYHYPIEGVTSWPKPDPNNGNSLTTTSLSRTGGVFWEIGESWPEPTLLDLFGDGSSRLAWVEARGPTRLPLSVHITQDWTKGGGAEGALVIDARQGLDPGTDFTPRAMMDMGDTEDHWGEDLLLIDALRGEIRLVWVNWDTGSPVLEISTLFSPRDALLAYWKDNSIQEELAETGPLKIFAPLDRGRGTLLLRDGTKLWQFRFESAARTWGTPGPAMFVNDLGFRAETVATGDLNGDGAVDLAVGGRGSTTSLAYLGNGDSTFGGSLRSGPGVFGGVTRGWQILGGGRQDLEDDVVSLDGSQLKVWAGTFSALTQAGSYESGREGVLLGLVDVDGDGQRDALRYAPGQLFVQLRVGASFSSDVILITGAPDAPRAGLVDADGDGSPETVAFFLDDGTLEAAALPDPASVSPKLQSPRVVSSPLDLAWPTAPANPRCDWKVLKEGARDRLVGFCFDTTVSPTDYKIAVLGLTPGSPGSAGNPVQGQELWVHDPQTPLSGARPPVALGFFNQSLLLASTDPMEPLVDDLVLLDRQGAGINSPLWTHVRGGIVADPDQDGVPDLVVGLEDNNVVWFKENQGQFNYNWSTSMPGVPMMTMQLELGDAARNLDGSKADPTQPAFPTIVVQTGLDLQLILPDALGLLP